MDGEYCGKVTDVPYSNACAAESVIGTEDELEAVDGKSDAASRGSCVGVKHLGGVDVLFGDNVKAWVLCDERGSCATKGHMVVWKGEVSMMGSYCERVGCVKRVMWVNSPKWKMGEKVRVESYTDGLLFLPFAARWETRVEEHLLARLVRMGL